MFTSPDGSTQPLQNQKFYITGYMNSVTKQKKISVSVYEPNFHKMNCMVESEGSMILKRSKQKTNRNRMVVND
jgi:hypothetical protein